MLPLATWHDSFSFCDTYFSPRSGLVMSLIFAYNNFCIIIHKNIKIEVLENGLLIPVIENLPYFPRKIHHYFHMIYALPEFNFPFSLKV